MTASFKTTSGVLQGDTLSPYIFIVLLNYALKKTLQDDVGFVVRKRNGSRHPAIHISVLVYADYICLLTESIDDVECTFHRLETSSAEIGLTINHNKTKAINLGQASVRHVRFANGDPVDSCDKIEYIGVPTSNAETLFDLVYPRHGQPRLNSAQSSTLKRMTLLKLVFANQL